jgi:hypothetical protein
VEGVEAVVVGRGDRLAVVVVVVLVVGNRVDLVRKGSEAGATWFLKGDNCDWNVSELC